MATDRLFGRYRPGLRRWARGRLPRWARDGDVDTSDLVQAALQHTFARLSSFESQQASALRGYLQQAVENRIRDRLRRATRRLNLVLPETSVRFSADAAPQHRALVDQETWGRYLGGLERLKDRERRLIVGRAEFGYSYRQLAGGTLAERLRSGPLPGPAAVAVAAQLAEGLAAVHEAGYVHGDVKPSNIGFTAAGSPKLLDFGLARRTRDAAVMGGTPRYLSPEVLSGRPTEEADDVWSLCVVLYEMLSGEHPFAGGGVDELGERIRRRRLARVAPSVTGRGEESAVVALAASLLTAPRQERPATARAFANVLHEVSDEP